MDKFYKKVTADETIHYGVFSDVTMAIIENDTMYASMVTEDSETTIIASFAEEIDSDKYYKYLLRVGSRPPTRPS